MLQLSQGHISRRLVPLEYPSPDRLEDAGGAHASADTHGDHAVFDVPSRHLAQQGSGELRASAAQRMPARNGYAVYVDLRRVDSQQLDHSKCLRRECLVQLDQGDIVERSDLKSTR